MENQLVWKDVFNIGIKIIDDEHQRLFMIINKLFALKEEEKRSRKVCQEGIKYFKEHALKHFEAEERYMELIAYEGIDVHKRLHRDFRENSLPALERELEREDYSPAAVDHFLAVCAGWLIGHTLTEDKAIAGEKRSRWAELLPEEELKAMKKVIIKLLEDMFRLKAQVISDSYSGEEFGESVYYRLVYGRKEDDEKWEILLALEDRILLSTIGKLMGTKSDKLDIILLNAARYMECQLVRRVMEHYPSISSYEMMEEDFLTYEQFREIFEKKQPQVSLLFDTNEGYISYCVIAPHLPEGGIGEKYFIEKEKQEKKKILVVDDSSTTRLGMELLLAENYDVSEVSSGAAAIRAITLERPDLVLLDYEMPVCDGRHVLEMLRAEKEFSDIPVIFLTSRDDQESVKNVLSLNADGYLLKYLKPADIKKRIDGYFSRKEA